MIFYPLFPWDGVTVRYPTDATICRAGSAVANCDNGAAVHQVDTGATDRLAGSPKFGRAAAASSCPNFGQLPHPLRPLAGPVVAFSLWKYPFPLEWGLLVLWKAGLDSEGFQKVLLRALLPPLDLLR